MLFCYDIFLQQVHGYFEDRGRYSKVCGVAVRSGGDLFVYDNCRGPSSGRARLYQCQDSQLRVNEISQTSYEVNIAAERYLVSFLRRYYV